MPDLRYILINFDVEKKPSYNLTVFFFFCLFRKGEIRSCYLKAGCQKEGNFRHQISNCDCISNAQ